MAIKPDPRQNYKMYKLLLGLSLTVGCASSRPAETGAAASSAARTLTAEEAGSHVGETATVEFTVAQVGSSKDSTFLNSKRYQKGQDPGFVGFIPGNAKAGFTQAFGDDLKIGLEGKKVQLTGTITSYKKNGEPQMVLTAPSQLKIVR